MAFYGHWFCCIRANADRALARVLDGHAMASSSPVLSRIMTIRRGGLVLEEAGNRHLRAPYSGCHVGACGAAPQGARGLLVDYQDKLNRTKTDPISLRSQWPHFRLGLTGYPCLVAIGIGLPKPNLSATNLASCCPGKSRVDIWKSGINLRPQAEKKFAGKMMRRVLPIDDEGGAHLIL